MDEEEIARQREEFSEKYGVEITLEDYKKIYQAEKAAKEREEQRQAEGVMQGSPVEEPNAKCNLCYADLSIIDNMLYGNRCVFCAPSGAESLPLRNIGLTEYLQLCYLDWRIYQAIVTRWKKTSGEEAKYYLLGCLAEMGYGGLAQCKSRKEKRKLLGLLRR